MNDAYYNCEDIWNSELIREDIQLIVTLELSILQPQQVQTEAELIQRC